MRACNPRRARTSPDIGTLLAVPAKAARSSAARSIARWRPALLLWRRGGLLRPRSRLLLLPLLPRWWRQRRGALLLLHSRVGLRPCSCGDLLLRGEMLLRGECLLLRGERLLSRGERLLLRCEPLLLRIELLLLCSEPLLRIELLLLLRIELLPERGDLVPKREAVFMAGKQLAGHDVIRHRRAEQVL